MDASDASVSPQATPRTGPPRITGPRSDYGELLVVDPQHYAIADELARGGMGRIVRAHDRRLGRPVAIKELLPGHDDARFEREARITARLAHPAIVAIHEAGRWPSGEPFFAMKLVAGTSLDKRIAETSTLAERRALVPSVIAAVDALAYAHSERVIHRDLKPANVLVGKYGETVVIDWGLAKDLAAAPGDDVAVGPYRDVGGAETVVGAVMGTPAYMPPEQAEGETVDERADVYALGALLYQVLAGVPPYEGKTTEDVLARVLSGPPRALAEISPDVPIELVAIVEKAMARDLAQRFPSAREMADELRRFQAGQLVTSHQYTFGELVRRWLQKYRAPIAVGAISVLALAVVGVASISKIVAETHRADREAANARVRADRGTLEHARALLDRDPTAAILALNDLSPGAAEWGAARMVVADAESRGVARVLVGDSVPISVLRFSDDGAQLAAVSGTAIIVWDLATGVKTRLLTHADGPIRGIAWSGDDIVHIDWNGRVGHWHVAHKTDDLVGTYQGDGVELSPDGRWLVIANVEDHQAQIIEVATGKSRAIGVVFQATWDSDAHTLVAWDRKPNEVRRIDARTGAVTARRLSRQGEILALGSVDGRALGVAYPNRLIDVANDKDLPTGHECELSLIAVLPDGNAATACSLADNGGRDELANTADQSVTIADGSRDVAKLVGHHGSLTAVTASRSGVIASADYSGEVRIWSRTPVAYTTSPIRTVMAVLEPDRKALITLHRNGYAVRRELATGATTTIERRRNDAGEMSPHVAEDLPEPEVDHGGSSPRAVVHAKHASQWVTRDRSNRLWIWDLKTGGRELCGVNHSCDDAETIAISGDGAFVAALIDGTTHVFDAVTGEGTELGGVPYALAFSDDGEQLAMANDSGRLRIFRPRAKTDTELPSLISGSTALAFAPGGHELAVGNEFWVQVFETDPVSLTLAPFKGHEGSITSLDYTDDGRLVSTSLDHTVRVWNVADRTSRVLQLPAKISQVDVAGGVAVTTSDDGTVRLWDIATESGRVLPGHDAAPVFGGVMADGTIIAVDGDGRISRYRDTTPVGEASLRTWIGALTSR
jgi:eukaryotic-like serine/threonine-protein kinase